jgi:NAD(P)-dependent dehydrogenase (short-subunit alcohol dehydrogenase family)
VDATNIAGSTLSPDIVAFVAGGGRGIGRACAVALARAGARVVVIARTASELEQTVETIFAPGGAAMSHTADVRDSRAVGDAVARTLTAWGRIDLLLNNAGMLGPIGPFVGSDDATWWQTLESNLRGPTLCIRLVLPGMLARRAGRIINLSSGAATRAVPNLSAYVVSKTALTRLSECLALELGGEGITVFSLHPGVVRTHLSEAAASSVEGERWIPWFRRYFDAGQDIAAEVAARTVVEIAAGRADALTGRFIDASAGLDRLLERAEHVVALDGLVLGLRS